MFESLDSTQQEPQAEDPVTGAEALGVFALILLLLFGSLTLFIVLGDRPYGMQCATLISYSGAIFIWTFFRTRGVHTKHKLSAAYVQQELPKLLFIHLTYLVGVFTLETWALGIRPTMSSWWLTSQGKKGMPPFDAFLMFTLMAVGISQIVLSRRILGRAKERALVGHTGK